MYRSKEEYNNVDQLIYSIYMDYGIRKFPVSAEELCKKMGLKIALYSEFSQDGQNLLRKKSEYGFFYSKTSSIYVNDSYSEETQRFTVFHELKHYICEDENDDDDDLAEYFSRHFMCPTIYLLLKGIDTPEKIAEICGVSYTAAYYSSKNILNRRAKYGNRVFDHEREFIEYLAPDLLVPDFFSDLAI